MSIASVTSVVRGFLPATAHRCRFDRKHNTTQQRRVDSATIDTISAGGWTNIIRHFVTPPICTLDVRLIAQNSLVRIPIGPRIRQAACKEQ
jgi:hypothetical protein